MFTRRPAVAVLLASLVVVALPVSGVAQQASRTDATKGRAAGPAMPGATPGIVRHGVATAPRLDLVRLYEDMRPGSELMKLVSRDLAAPPGRQNAGTQEVTTQAGAPQGPAMELSLSEAIELAVRHNLQAQVSRYNMDSTFEGIKAARAPFDPQITFNLPSQFQRSTRLTTRQIEGAESLTSENVGGGASFRDTLEWGTTYTASWDASRSQTNDEFSTFNPVLSSGLRFSLSQPLLNGFGDVNRTGIRVAQNSYEGSREQFRGQLQNIVLQVYQAYWSLVGQIRSVEVQQEAVDLAEQQLRRNQTQIEIGTLAPIDAVQAQQTAESARLQLIQAQNALLNAQDQLKQLLNIEAVHDAGWDVTIVPTDEPATTAEPIDLEQAIATALDNDPGLRQQRLAVQNARLNLNAARNNLLPQLNANANLSLSGTGGTRIIRGDLGGGVTEVIEGGFIDALDQLISGDFNTWSFGLTMQLPLHNWSAEASHARASIGERQSLRQLDTQQQQVVFQVRTAVRNVENGARAIATAQLNTQFAEQQLDAERRKFEVGTSTNFEVLQFQRQLSSARLQELNAIIQFNVARAQFLQATGTLLETLGVTIQEAGRGLREE